MRILKSPSLLLCQLEKLQGMQPGGQPCRARCLITSSRHRGRKFEIGSGRVAAWLAKGVERTRALCARTARLPKCWCRCLSRQTSHARAAHSEINVSRRSSRPCPECAQPIYTRKTWNLVVDFFNCDIDPDVNVQQINKTTRQNFKK